MRRRDAGRNNRSIERDRSRNPRNRRNYNDVLSNTETTIRPGADGAFEECSHGRIELGDARDRILQTTLHVAGVEAPGIEPASSPTTERAGQTVADIYLDACCFGSQRSVRMVHSFVGGVLDTRPFYGWGRARKPANRAILPADRARLVETLSIPPVRTSCST